MPLYATICLSCHQEGQIFRKIADRDLRLICDCGGQLQRQIQAPAVKGDIEPYVSPVTGKPIMSASARRKDLRSNGYIEWEPGMRDTILKNRERSLEAAVAPAMKAVDEIVTSLNVAGKLETSNAA